MDFCLKYTDYYNTYQQLIEVRIRMLRMSMLDDSTHENTQPRVHEAPSTRDGRWELAQSNTVGNIPALNELVRNLAEYLCAEIQPSRPAWGTLFVLNYQLTLSTNVYSGSVHLHFEGQMSNIEHTLFIDDKTRFILTFQQIAEIYGNLPGKYINLISTDCTAIC